jgi:hypothetical protein
LCFEFVQITRTTPRRRTILHLSQIRLTDARTFMIRSRLPDDPAPLHIAGRELHDHPIADQQPHEIPLDAPADVRRNPVRIDLHLV